MYIKIKFSVVNIIFKHNTNISRYFNTGSALCIIIELIPVSCPHTHICLPAGCATSSPVTVATSTSWSVTVMVESTSTTESGAPMLRPSKCSHCAVSSNEPSNEPSLSQPSHLSHFHLLLLPLLLLNSYHFKAWPVLSDLHEKRMTAISALFTFP